MSLCGLSDRVGFPAEQLLMLACFELHVVDISVDLAASLVRTIDNWLRV